MDGNEIISTIFGSFVFVFFIIIFWGKLVNTLGPIGGFIAAMLIAGTMWIVNHANLEHMITQSGSVWIDMGMAAGVGVFTSSIIQGDNIKKSLPTLSAAMIGALISGTFLCVI